MNKNEFIDWAYNTYRKFIDDKEAIVAYENDEKIIVLDIKTDKTFVFNLMKSPKCFTKDPIISMAVAYASLKNIEIPTIEEPKYERVKEGENYYWVGTYCGRLVAIAGTENPIDSNFDNNNYFHTKERANEVADKINFLLKLERLHEIYCPDYKPNWKDNSKKNFISYSANSNAYIIDYCINYRNESTVYFPTTEIALKVCNQLDKELI